MTSFDAASNASPALGRRPRARSVRRWHVAMIVLAVYLTGLFVLFVDKFRAVGIVHLQLQVGDEAFGIWFADLFAILAANDAVTAGQNPYAKNPFDYLNRPHGYPHWWLYLRHIGLSRADSYWMGAALGLVFFVVVMAWLRPRSLREMLWYLVVFWSVPVLLAIERANNDLVVFLVLAPLVPCLLSCRLAFRVIAPLFIAMATALKIYPAVAALVLMAAAPWREWRARWFVATALLLPVTLDLVRDLKEMGSLLPKPEGLYTFGAGGGFNLLGWTGVSAWCASAAAGVGIVVAWWRRQPFDGWEPRPEHQRDWLHFVLGASLLTGCFFAGQSYFYRWIFGVWLAPFLWVLPRDSGAPFVVRRFASALQWLLLAVIWIDPLCDLTLTWLPEIDRRRAEHWVFLAEQPITWTFFAGLLAFLTHFAQLKIRAIAGRAASV